MTSKSIERLDRIFTDLEGLLRDPGLEMESAESIQTMQHHILNLLEAHTKGVRFAVVWDEEERRFKVIKQHDFDNKAITYNVHQMELTHANAVFLKNRKETNDS